jgi:hypothetical protein
MYDRTSLLASEYQTIFYYPYSLVILHVQAEFTCGPSSNSSSIYCGTHRVITDAIVTDTFRVGICLLYGFYPLKYHANDYFRKKGDRNAIGEYTFVKNILYIGIALMVFFGSIYYVLSTLHPIHNILYSLVYSSQLSLQYSVTAGALWMLSLLIKKDFRYYLAKAYIKSVLDNDDDTKKMNLLIMAVNSYNKYLIRFLGLQINTLVYHALVTSVKPRILIRGHGPTQIFHMK